MVLLDALAMAMLTIPQLTRDGRGKTFEGTFKVHFKPEIRKAK